LTAIDFEQDIGTNFVGRCTRCRFDRQEFLRGYRCREELHFTNGNVSFPQSRIHSHERRRSGLYFRYTLQGRHEQPYGESGEIMAGGKIRISSVVPVVDWLAIDGNTS